MMSKKQEIEDALEQLKDEDENVRSQAALSLGWIGEEEVVEPLILTLENDPSAKVRANAAMALGQLGDERSIDFLIAALHDKDSTVRGMVSYSLGLMKVKEAVDPLISLVKNDPDKETKIAAADSLGEIAEVYSLKSLARIYVQEDNESVKNQIEETINKICKAHNIKNLAEIIQEIESNEEEEIEAIEEEQIIETREEITEEAREKTEREKILEKIEEEEKQKLAERKRIIEQIEQEELAKKRHEQIEIITAKLPPMLEFAIHDEIITYDRICSHFDCDDITLELSLNEMPKVGFDIEIHSIERYFRVLKPQTELSDEAKEKIMLLRRKFGIDW